MIARLVPPECGAVMDSVRRVLPLDRLKDKPVASSCVIPETLSDADVLNLQQTTLKQLRVSRTGPDNSCYASSAPTHSRRHDEALSKQGRVAPHFGHEL